MNEFAFFDLKSCYLVKSNAFCSFFGESNFSLKWSHAFEINWPLSQSLFLFKETFNHASNFSFTTAIWGFKGHVIRHFQSTIIKNRKPLFLAWLSMCLMVRKSSLWHGLIKRLPDKNRSNFFTNNKNSFIHCGNLLFRVNRRIHVPKCGL